MMVVVAKVMAPLLLTRLDMQVPFIKDGEFLGSIEVNPDEKCRHPKATPTGETCESGCCDYYICPDCGKCFLVECPD